MKSFPPEPDIPLSPRTRRLVQQVATVVALACFLSLLMLRAGGASPPSGAPTNEGQLLTVTR